MAVKLPPIGVEPSRPRSGSKEATAEEKVVTTSPKSADDDCKKIVPIPVSPADEEAPGPSSEGQKETEESEKPAVRRTKTGLALPEQSIRRRSVTIENRINDDVAKQEEDHQPLFQRSKHPALEGVDVETMRVVSLCGRNSAKD